MSNFTYILSTFEGNDVEISKDTPLEDLVQNNRNKNQHFLVEIIFISGILTGGTTDIQIEPEY